MRLTAVINSLGIGGAEKIFATLVNALAARGHQVSVLSFTEAEQVILPLLPQVHHHCLNIGTKGLALFPKIQRALNIPAVLRQALIASHPDVILSFMDQANLFTLLAMKKQRMPIVIAERADPAFSSIVDPSLPRALRLISRRVRDRLYRRAAAVIVQTNGAAEYFPTCLQKTITAIPNPVIPPTPHSVDTPSPPTIVGVGRLVWQKRFTQLIQSFCAVAKRYPEWRLVIYGGGPEREKLSAEIAASGFSDRITLAGVVLEPWQRHPQSDIFVLSSESEGFPGALCEAMAHGMAVIATRCRYGPQEIIRPGENGILVPVNDTDALSAALERLITHPDERQRLGDNARKIARDLSLDAIADRWCEVLKSVSSRSSS